MFNFNPLQGQDIALTQIYEPNQRLFLLPVFRLGGVGNRIFFPHLALSLQKKNSADVKTKQLLLEAKDKRKVLRKKPSKKPNKF